jgi:hypothetical protein
MEWRNRNSEVEERIMVAVAAVRPSSAAPQPSPARDDAGRQMDQAIGRSQQDQSAAPEALSLPPQTATSPVVAAANDPSASGAAGPGGPQPTPSGSARPSEDQPTHDPAASGQAGPAGQQGSQSGDPAGLPSALTNAGNVLADPAQQIGQLNSDGDQVVISMTAEAKGQIPVPIGNLPVGIGAKGQYGYDITVSQVGDAPQAGQNGTQPTYDVTFDKNLLGGATIEPPVPGIDPAGELNLTSADAVTMNFQSPEDAGRAVQALERLAAAETIRDVGEAATPGLSNPAANPLPEGDGSLSGPSPTEPIASRVGPSQEDLTFLRDNITSYSTTLGVQERGKVAAKFANLGIEPRLDGAQQITRTVELPRDGQPGRLTYTVSGDLQASSKEKLTVGVQQFDQLEVGYTPQNIVDHGVVRSELSVSWDLPADRTDPSVSGRPVPELGALSGEGLGAPSEVSARYSYGAQTQSLADLSRTDQTQGSLEVSVKNPGQHVGPAFNSFLDGDLRGAFGGMGDDFSVTATQENVRRDGLEQQHEIGLELADVGEAKVSLIGEIGVDDVSGRRTATFTGADLQRRAETVPPSQPVPPVGEPRPAGTPGQMVVTPNDGLNVRSVPSIEGAEVSAFQHGTFVQPTGARQADASGREWVEVRGSDVADKPVQGWVDGQYLQPHPQGAMDEAGRINPDLEAEGYREHVVQEGDTVWDIARRDGANFRDTLELNSGHLINPGMIFPGDKVYIPGTAHPPALPPVVEAPPTVPEQAPPSGSDVGGSGPSGSEPGGPSAPPASGPSNPAPSGPTGPTPPPSQSGAPTPQDPSASGAPAGPVVEAPVGPQAGEQPPSPTTQRTDAQGRTLDDIVTQYQVPFDDRPKVEWSPGGAADLPLIGGQVPSQEVSAGEAEVLDDIMPDVLKIDAMKSAKDKAEGTALRPGDDTSRMSPTEWNDGHQDAFRHAYWNALMGANAGDSEATRFATAHEEGTADNPAAREAMDLYNNEQGRRIAQENPDASDDELAQLVRDAVNNGEMVVIDRNGNLAWSDEVAFGQHGQVPAGAAAGEPAGPLIDKSAS